MLVVSNTSPLNYLVLIEQIELLPALFQTVTIPQAVQDELSASEAPEPVRQWISQPPAWLHRQTVQSATDPDLASLDPGETAAILLALELDADLIVLDDMKARRIATTKGLAITGTLGILAEAANRQLIDLPVVVEALRNTSFWVSERVLQRLLDRHM